MQEKHSRVTYLLLIAALVSGLLHVSLVAYQHIGIVPEYVFFLLAGTAQIVWVVLFIWKQDDLFYFSGLILHGGVAAMWLLTRIFPAPFVNTPEPVNILGMSIFLLELFILVALATWHNRKEHIHIFSTKQFSMLLSIPIIAGLLMFAGAHVSANTVFSGIEVGDHSHGGSGKGHGDSKPHVMEERSDSKNHDESEVVEDRHTEIMEDVHIDGVDDKHSDEDDHHD